MWPLSLPVVDHWLTNCGLERFAMVSVMYMDRGTVTSATTARTGET